MVKTKKRLFQPEKPGEVLRRYIIEGNHPITQEQLAKAMGVSRLSINQLVRGKRAVTAAMALRLARVLSTTPDLWLNLQREIEVFEAQEAIGAKLDKLPVLRKSSA